MIYSVKNNLDLGGGGLAKQAEQAKQYVMPGHKPPVAATLALDADFKRSLTLPMTAPPPAPPKDPFTPRVLTVAPLPAPSVIYSVRPGLPPLAPKVEKLEPPAASGASAVIGGGEVLIPLPGTAPAPVPKATTPPAAVEPPAQPAEGGAPVVAEPMAIEGAGSAAAGAGPVATEGAGSAAAGAGPVATEGAGSAAAGAGLMATEGAGSAAAGAGPVATGGLAGDAGGTGAGVTEGARDAAQAGTAPISSGADAARSVEPSPSGAPARTTATPAPAAGGVQLAPWTPEAAETLRRAVEASERLIKALSAGAEQLFSLNARTLELARRRMDPELMSLVLGPLGRLHLAEAPAALDWLGQYRRGDDLRRVAYLLHGPMQAGSAFTRQLRGLGQLLGSGGPMLQASSPRERAFEREAGRAFQRGAGSAEAGLLGALGYLGLEDLLGLNGRESTLAGAWDGFREGLADTFLRGDNPFHRQYEAEREHLENAAYLFYLRGDGDVAAALGTAGTLLTDVTGTSDLYQAGTGRDLTRFVEDGNARTLTPTERLLQGLGGALKLTGAAFQGATWFSAVRVRLAQAALSRALAAEAAAAAPNSAPVMANGGARYVLSGHGMAPAPGSATFRLPPNVTLRFHSELGQPLGNGAANAVELGRGVGAATRVYSGGAEVPEHLLGPIESAWLKPGASAMVRVSEATRLSQLIAEITRLNPGAPVTLEWAACRTVPGLELPAAAQQALGLLGISIGEAVQDQAR